MSVFEGIMMFCFGFSWPFSILKTWKSKSSGSKSYLFMWLVIIGYAAGIVHKYLYSWDWVVALYAVNAAMVFADCCLCCYFDYRTLPTASAKHET